MHLLRWFSMFASLAVTIPVSLAGQGSQTVSRAEARNAIQDGNIEWGKARVALRPGVTLTRFDARVLSVEPKGDDWVAIILEKLEFERKADDGKTERVYAVWVTRDAWRKVSSDKWVFLFSEEVGHEQWQGTIPPLANW
jgi:hypothetical protein